MAPAPIGGGFCSAPLPRREGLGEGDDGSVGAALSVPNPPPVRGRTSSPARGEGHRAGPLPRREGVGGGGRAIGRLCLFRTPLRSVAGPPPPRGGRATEQAPSLGGRG